MRNQSLPHDTKNKKHETQNVTIPMRVKKMNNNTIEITIISEQSKHSKQRWRTRAAQYAVLLRDKIIPLSDCFIALPIISCASTYQESSACSRWLCAIIVTSVVFIIAHYFWELKTSDFHVFICVCISACKYRTTKFGEFIQKSRKNGDFFSLQKIDSELSLWIEWALRMKCIDFGQFFVNFRLWNV